MNSTRLRSALALVAAATLATLAVGAAGPTGAAHADEPSQGKLLLMLDASGSMKAKDPSGLTKIAAAKKALTTVVGALPDDAEVGLRVYGATQPGGRPTKAACADTQLVHPITTLDKPGLNRAINAFQAKGETPIAHSLTEALKDLGTEGKRNIVLVSDGEESCVPDPCPSVRRLVDAGVDLQIDTVGFGVNAKARQQLQCIAAAGHGTYYDAKNATSLTASLSKLSQRALRPFSVSGTPVRATETAEQSPTLKPGQYTDSFTTKAPVRHLQLARTPGTDVRFTLTARPPSSSDTFAVERFTTKVTTPEGESCDTGNEGRFDPAKLSEVVTVSVKVSGRPVKNASRADKACADAPVLLVALQRTEGSAAAQPVELLYVEEPVVRNAPSLPPALSPDEVPPLLAPAGSAAVPTVGGGAFSDAPTMVAGTYSDTILPGEQVFYRVRVEFGQRAAVTADVPAPGTRIDLGSTSYTTFSMRAWNPARFDITDTTGKPDTRGSLGPSGDSLVLGTYTPQVRWANRDSFGNGAYSFTLLRDSSISGYYYFAIARSREKAGEDSSVPVPIRLRVAVEGEPSGEPQYAAGSPSSTVSPSATAPATTPATAVSPPAGDASADTGTSPLVWVGLALVVLAGGAGAAYTWSRRRSPTPTVGS